MTKRNTSPAFPTTTENVAGGGSSRGMTLRDYFAGIAAAQMVPGAEPCMKWEESVAKRAYAFADAMLEERDRVDKIPE